MNIKPEELNDNIFKLIANDWMLITAGDSKAVNTMTASFGGFGVLFFKNVVHVYVRPERYTFDFMEKSDYFSMSFFDSSYRDKLTYCGRTSGRQENKIEKCGFSLLYDKNDVPYFEEARITVICKKIYYQDIQKENFTDKSAYEKTYSTGGLHRMYVGEIADIITK